MRLSPHVKFINFIEMDGVLLFLVPEKQLF